MSRPATARRPAPVVGGNAVLCVPHTLNSPLNYTDPTGHRETSGCDMLDCTRGGTVNPTTYRSADGTYSFADPNLSARHLSPIGEKLTKIATADAYGVGVMGSSSLDTPLAGIELIGGREVVHVRQSGETTQFIVIGGAIRIGPSTSFIGSVKNMAKGGSPANASIAPYGSIIQNVDNAVEDYSGLFAYQSTTVAYKAGISVSENYVPADEARFRANSVSVGPAFGFSLTHSTGLSYAIPIVSHYPGQSLPVFHNPLPYLADLASKVWSAIRE